MRSLVLVAAVEEPEVVADEPVVVVAEFVVVVAEVFVAGRTVAIAAASERDGLVVVEMGISPPLKACTDTMSAYGGCSGVGEEAVWRGLCVHVCWDREDPTSWFTM